MRAVNRGLRAAILADQRNYARFVREHQRGYNGPEKGIYEVSINRRLTSASTVVVSSLIPAFELPPGGTEGHGWISATVRVPSGRAVSLRELLRDPSRALPALARDWKAQVRRTKLWPSVALYPEDYRPTFRNYRYFALTPSGLAFGFWQVPAGPRLEATVPYSQVRPYLNKLGAELVVGVRPPR